MTGSANKAHGDRQADPTDISRDEIKAQLAQLTMKIGLPVSESLISIPAWVAPTPDRQQAAGHDNGAAFVGALGAEYAFNRDWAARLEYQYTTPLGDKALTRPGPNSTTVCWRSAWSIASVR